MSAADYLIQQIIKEVKTCDDLDLLDLILRLFAVDSLDH